MTGSARKESMRSWKLWRATRTTTSSSALRKATEAAGTAAAEADSTNIPSCNGGSIRGTISGLPLAASIDGALDPQNCESTLQDPTDDVQAFINGFITLTDVPLD